MLIAIAVWTVRETLNSSHFEGYNLLLGAMLVVQGALTLAATVPPFQPLRRVLPRSH